MNNFYLLTRSTTQESTWELS